MICIEVTIFLRLQGPLLGINLLSSSRNQQFTVWFKSYFEILFWAVYREYHAAVQKTNNHISMAKNRMSTAEYTSEEAADSSGISILCNCTFWSRIFLYYG